MLDANGKNTVLSLNDALTDALADATSAGVEVITGSPEEMIANYMAQTYYRWDAALYASVVKQFSPTGTDLDIQNPGNPRLQSSVSAGFLKLVNSTGSPIDVAANAIFTAPNGNKYTNGSTTIAVSGGTTGYLSVQSVLKGKAQNLPANQSFTSSYGFSSQTNPQPFVTGSDTETDSEYVSRLVFLKTSNASQAATPSATLELLNYYQAARFYVNNGVSDFTTPVPIPAGGYIAVVLFPSGVNASAAEISNAINILSNRLEFGNIIRNSTTLHPILTGTVYTGTFPQLYSAAVAQAIKVTLAATVTVRFSNGTDSSEKAILSAAFATQFVQNIINFYGGAAGNFHLSFQALGSPAPAPVTSTPAVVAANGIGQIIGPLVSVEQMRAFISDEVNAASTPNLSYLACTALTAIMDPQVVGEVTHTLDIAAPAGGHVSTIDFVNDPLFSDSTSWYDRYIFLDPSLITITVNEG